MVVVILPSLRSGGTEWQTWTLVAQLCNERRMILWVFDAQRTEPRLLAKFQALSDLEFFLGWNLKTLVKIAAKRPRCILSYAINFYIPELLLKLLSGAVLITERRNLYHWFESDRRRRLQERLRNFLTKTVICNSRTVQERVAVIEPEVAHKTVVIPNCVVTEEVECNATRSAIVAVANIKQGKGLEDIGHIFIALAASAFASDGIRFEIYGRLDDPKVFADLSKQGISRVYKGEQDSSLIFSRAFCICHLSRSEGFPNAVLEAVAAGVVPILSDIAVHRELFADCAVFVRDRQSAQTAVQQVIDMRAQHPDELFAWSLRCKQFALRYSPQQRAVKYREIFDACCA